MQRPNLWSLVLTLAVVAVAVAGCLGDDEKPPEPTGCTTCQVETPTKQGIRGKVLDDVFVPLAGATVILREEDLETTTDAEGRYAFNDLAPGTYTVFAQNPPSHVAKGEQVQLAADTVEEVDFILDPVPPAAEPYFDEQLQEGLIACSVAFQVVRTGDLCGPHDQNAKSRFTFDLDPRLTTLFVGIDSQGGQLGKQELSLTIETPASIEPRGVQDAAPFAHRWDFDETNAWPAWEEPDQVIRFDVRANHDASMPQVVYQQKLQVYVSFFYNGMEVPPDHTPFPDG